MSDTAEKRAGGGERVQRAVLITCGVLVLLGIVGYVLQLTMGLGGYADHAPWGLYIVAFYCAAGLGAGGLIVGAVGIVARALDAVVLSKLYLVAVAAFVVASACVIADLGDPLALFHMVISPNLAGPLFYDMIILVAGIAMGAIGGMLVRRGAFNRTALVVASLAVGILVLAIEAWLLSITYAHESWSLLLGFTPALAQAALFGIAALVLLGHEKGSLPLMLACGAGAIVLTEGIEAAIGIKDTLTGAQLAAFIQTPLFWIAALAAVACIVLIGMKNVRYGAIAALVEAVFLKAAAIWSGQAISITSGDAFLGGFGIGFEEVLVLAGVLALGVLVYLGMRMLADKPSKEPVTSEQEADDAKAVTA